MSCYRLKLWATRRELHIRVKGMISCAFDEEAIGAAGQGQIETALAQMQRFQRLKQPNR
jgi:hypothetical protein